MFLPKFYGHIENAVTLFNLGINDSVLFIDLTSTNHQHHENVDCCRLQKCSK